MAKMQGAKVEIERLRQKGNDKLAGTKSNDKQAVTKRQRARGSDKKAEGKKAVAKRQ